MDTLTRLAQATAEWEWARDYPEEQVLLDNPYKTKILDFEPTRSSVLEYRRSVWRARLRMMLTDMIIALVVSLAFVIVGAATTPDHLQSWYFSHWWDPLAVPVLLTMDAMCTYLVGDSGASPDTTFLVSLRLLFGLSGVLYGFLLPFLVVAIGGLCLFVLPYLALRLLRLGSFF